MDEIRSHHFETMGNHCLLVFTGGIIISGFFGWCRISSIHSMFVFSRETASLGSLVFVFHVWNGRIHLVLMLLEIVSSFFSGVLTKWTVFPVLWLKGIGPLKRRNFLRFPVETNKGEPNKTTACKCVCVCSRKGPKTETRQPKTSSSLFGLLLAALRCWGRFSRWLFVSFTGQMSNQKL